MNANEQVAENEELQYTFNRSRISNTLQDNSSMDIPCNQKHIIVPASALTVKKHQKCIPSTRKIELTPSNILPAPTLQMRYENKHNAQDLNDPR